MYKLDQELMTKFMESFTLDQIDELYEYDIYQLLDKEKYEAQQKQQKYFDRINQTLGKLKQ